MANAVPVVAILATLALTPGFLLYYDVTPKLVILAMGLVAASWYGFQRLNQLWSRREGRWFSLLLGLQWLSLAISTVFAQSPELSLGGTNWRRYGLFTQTAVLLFGLLGAAILAERPARLKSWLRIFAAGGLIASSYICLQYFGFDPVLPGEAYRIGVGEWSILRPPGTLGHAGYAATFTIYSVFAGVSLAIEEEPNFWRGLGWSAAGMGSIAIVLSGTRSAILGLAVGGLALFFFVRPQIPFKRFLAALALFALAVAAFYLSPPGQALRSRVRWSIEDPLGGARLMLWRDATLMGVDHWTTGIGPESFPNTFPGYQSEQLARAYPDFYHESPHNILIEAWTSQGWSGLILMAGFCWLGLRALWRPGKTAILAAGFTGALVSQMFLSFTAITGMWFLLFLGMLAALAPPEETAITKSAWNPIQRKRISGLLTLAAISIVPYIASLFVMDRLLERTRDHLSAGDLGDAIATYDEARGWAPPGVAADLWFSRGLVEAASRAGVGAALASQAIPVAVAAANRATSNAEDLHNAFYSRAQLAAVVSDPPAIEANLRLAIDASPSWFKPHWTLAELLLLLDRTGEALEQARLAVYLDREQHPEVTASLEKIEAAIAGQQRP